MTEEKYLTENSDEIKRKPISLERPENTCRKPIPLEKRMFDEQSDERITNYFPGKQNYYSEQRQHEYLAKSEIQNMDCEKKVTQIQDVRVSYNKYVSTFDFLWKLCLLGGLVYLLSGLFYSKYVNDGSFGVYGLCLIPLSVVLKSIEEKAENTFSSRPVRSVIKCEESFVKVIPDDPLNRNGKIMLFKSMQTDVPEIILHSKIKCGIGCTHAVLKVSDIERVTLEKYLKDNNIEYTGSVVNVFK